MKLYEILGNDGLVKGTIYRKEWYLPSNIGVPVNFPIIQFCEGDTWIINIEM